MNDTLSLTYKNKKLTIMLGDRELPLGAVLEPAEIVISAVDPPTLRFEMVIDDMEIDDMEAFGRFVTKDELAASDE